MGSKGNWDLGVLLKRWSSFGRFSHCWKEAAGGPGDKGQRKAWRGNGAQSTRVGPHFREKGGPGAELDESGVGSPTRKPAVSWVKGVGLPESPRAEAGRTGRAEKAAEL